MKKTNEISIGKSLVPWLGKTMKLIDNSIEDILNDNNIELSTVQFVVLKNLYEKDGISQNELAFFVNRDKSTLTRMLSTLEKKNYIIKKHCKKDKRRCEIHISPKGTQLLETSERYFTEFVEKMEKGISQEEKKALTSIITKLQNNLIGDGTSPFFKDQK